MVPFQAVDSSRLPMAVGTDLAGGSCSYEARGRKSPKQTLMGNFRVVVQNTGLGFKSQVYHWLN